MTAGALSQNWLGYFIYFTAYIAALGAFACNSVFLLRALTIFSSSCFAIYYFNIPKETQWLDFLSEIAVVTVNSIMIIMLWYREKSIKFTDEEKEIHETIFCNFSKFEFYKLIKFGSWHQYHAGDFLIKKGSKVESLYFIYSGKVDIVVDGQVKAQLSDGALVGEVSFSLKQNASADVIASTPVRIVSWSQDALLDITKRNPAMKNSIEAVITQDLAKKLGNGNFINAS